MARYIIVTVPIKNVLEYKIQVLRTITEGLIFERKKDIWCDIDTQGSAIFISRYNLGPSPPPMSYFKTIKGAKQRITELQYENDKSNVKVVFDTLTSNPPKETGT